MRLVVLLAALLGACCGQERWRFMPKAHLELFSAKCTIPVATPEVFKELTKEHNGNPPPTIISPGKDNSLFQKMTEKANILESYGETIVTLSTANTHSYEKLEIPFKEYVETMLNPRELTDRGDTSWYLFGNNNYSDWVNFTEHYNRPEWTYDREPFFSFGIGGSGSGVPFHTHGAVFAEVLHGYKRWFLTPPDYKPIFNPDETSFYWITEVLPTIEYHEATQKMLECILEPNQVLWIPSQWWHATLNFGQSVFISTFI